MDSASQVGVAVTWPQSPGVPSRYKKLYGAFNYGPYAVPGVGVDRNPPIRAREVHYPQTNKVTNLIKLRLP